MFWFFGSVCVIVGYLIYRSERSRPALVSPSFPSDEKNKLINEVTTLIQDRKYWRSFSQNTKYYQLTWREIVDIVEELDNKYPLYIFLPRYSELSPFPFSLLDCHAGAFIDIKVKNK